MIGPNSKLLHRLADCSEPRGTKPCDLMSEAPDIVVLEIPARIADLAFRIAIPRDWNSLELPAEEVDFSSPGTFFPLMLAAAPWAAVILIVAGRPGFENGTLQDWSLFL